jgi:hypothetical protein
MKTFIETQALTLFLEQHTWPTKLLFDDWIENKKYNLSLEEISSPQFSIPKVYFVDLVF